MQVATQDLPIPAEGKARDVRKMISLFTYSLIKELAARVNVHEDDIYLRYLMGGGISPEQARTVVNRTRDEFIKLEFGDACLQAGKDVVKKWQNGEKDIQGYLQNLLALI